MFNRRVVVVSLLAASFVFTIIAPNLPVSTASLCPTCSVAACAYSPNGNAFAMVELTSVQEPGGGYGIVAYHESDLINYTKGNPSQMWWRWYDSPTQTEASSWFPPPNFSSTNSSFSYQTGVYYSIYNFTTYTSDGTTGGSVQVQIYSDGTPSVTCHNTNIPQA